MSGENDDPKTQGEYKQLPARDRATLRLLEKTELKREELRQLEANLAASIRDFGARRGYLFGAFRESNVRTELRREGYKV